MQPGAGNMDRLHGGKAIRYYSDQSLHIRNVTLFCMDIPSRKNRC
jgi:hypothetical protein